MNDARVVEVKRKRKSAALPHGIRLCTYIYIYI